MKKIVCLIILLSMNLSFAESKSANSLKAEKLSIALATVDYAHFKKRLALKVFSVIEKDNQVKVELGVGTVERPSKIHNCITITFSSQEEGFVENINNEIDAGLCEF